MAVVVIISDSVYIDSANSAQNEDGEERIQTSYPVNQAGQTYGGNSGDYGKELVGPDLVLAEATNGAIGYVLESDLQGPDHKTPEEALQWQSQQKPDQSIPVYEKDGTTIIGEFVMSRSSGE
ncbi:hypothetical protein [Paenibacillus taichungensis]|uniref:hypothetical protein n=2 Tax=Paenibacillus TaxID=44249 RepID=UPI0015C62904|nr:hypothetical protein [Paenibacillus taichungensis]